MKYTKSGNATSPDGKQGSSEERVVGSLLCVTAITLMLTPPHTYHGSPGLLPTFTPWTATAGGGAAAPSTTLPRHRHIHEPEGTLRSRISPAALLMPQVRLTEQIQLGLWWREGVLVVRRRGTGYNMKIQQEQPPPPSPFDSPPPHTHTP